MKELIVEIDNLESLKTLENILFTYESHYKPDFNILIVKVKKNKEEFHYTTEIINDICYIVSI